MTPLNHLTHRTLVPLRDVVAEFRRKAADADWAGDTAAARAHEQAAEAAIAAGQDPVPMF